MILRIFIILHFRHDDALSMAAKSHSHAFALGFGEDSSIKEKTYFQKTAVGYCFSPFMVNIASVAKS